MHQTIDPLTVSLDRPHDSVIAVPEPLSPPTKIVPYLDGWRGLAILLVLASHFGTWHFRWTGQFGVALFFVLSGFFMCDLLFLKKVDLTTFLVRRFNRVIPTFWLFTMAMALYARFLQPTPYSLPFGELLSTLFFSRTYWPTEIDIWNAHWPIGHFWSLNVEEHSYLYLAAGVLLSRVVKVRGVVLAFLGMSLMIVVILNIMAVIRLPMESHWFIRSQFAALGLIASATYRFVTRCVLPKQKPLYSWIPVLTFAIAAACFKAPGQAALNFTLGPLLLAFTINHLNVAPKLIKSFLSNPVMRWFGTCSFSIYLWQQLFVSFCHGWTGSALFPAAMGLCAIAAGTISYYFFEHPLRVHLNTLWTRRAEASLMRAGA